MDCRTRDLDCAIEAVGTIYCPHALYLDRRASTLDVRLRATAKHGTSVVRLAYGARVEVDAGDFPDLYLFMRCTGGSGHVQQHGHEARWHRGSTMPVSAGQRTQFAFDSDFEQVSLRLNAAELRACCERHLGRTLDEDVRFALNPFSTELEQTWHDALAMMEQLPDELPPAARAALQEFMLTLVLTSHPHNHSEALVRPEPVSRPGSLVRAARSYLEAHLGDAQLSVSRIAQALGVSVRALQIAFQDHEGTTPSEAMRSARLTMVREQLLQPQSGASVTDVALAHGFVHLGRFAQHYRTRYGEAPSDTLRAAQRRLRRA